MSNDILAKAEAVKKAYPGPKWAHKVNNMSESQILATYFRLKQANKV